MVPRTPRMAGADGAAATGTTVAKVDGARLDGAMGAMRLDMVGDKHGGGGVTLKPKWLNRKMGDDYGYGDYGNYEPCGSMWRQLEAQFACIIVCGGFRSARFLRDSFLTGTF